MVVYRTVNSDLAIRLAIPSDVEAVSSILTEAAAWLVARGIPMWRASELQPAQIETDVAEQLFYLAELDDEPVATIKFQLSDPLFWPEVVGDDSAFVHRLAVRRRFAGRGVSQALLAWAARRATTLGRSHLRLDCEASRRKLRDLYEGFGFTHHSDRQVGPYFVSLYELDVRTRGSARDRT
jgi:GNAT superfamily N-acetyltransferase